jgi:mono/diheme cytochrome c family protein
LKKALKILLTITAGLVLIAAGVVIYILAAWDSAFDAPYPDVAASTDPGVIARGKHLAFGPAHCSTCHVPMDRILDVEKGLDMPLSGGWELVIPPGVFRAPNITPDMETGIGKLTDGELARIMRHSVGADGRFLMPFMPFQGMSDEDLIAIISFLRAQEPVRNTIPRSEYTFLGKSLLALGAMKPQGPAQSPEKSVQPDSTAGYGRYLAHSVANCVGCHTERDMMTGESTGPAFAGGMVFDPDAMTGGYAFVSSNLTPDPETGLAQPDERAFISRFRDGRLHNGTPMPWGAFSRMDDLELKAIHRYLRSLAPVRRNVAQTIYGPGERLPGGR